MAAFDFPASPSNGDTVTVNGLTYSYNSTKTRWEAADSIEVVSDASPQLGGNLDVNGNDIVSTSNGDIEIDPDGSGVLVFKGNATKGAGQFKLNCESNSHGIVIKGPPHSAAASYTLTLPNDDGSANQVLKTDGLGVLSWTDVSGGDVVDDTSPQLGGDLDVNGKSIVSISNGNIELTPNGSGVVRIDGSNGVDIESGGLSIKNSGAQSYVRFYCEVSNAHYAQLQAPAHADFSGNTTLTLPATTDTLVGRATTDTLTNKTLASPDVTGSITVDGVDGGGVLRAWPAAPSSYNMFGTANMVNNEYAVLTDGTNTFIGGGSGGSTKIRYSNNQSDKQIEVSSSGITFTGGTTTTGLAVINPTSGSVTIGPQNTSFCHFSTDRSKHYFNKVTHFDGGAVDYDTGDHFLLPNANNSQVSNLSTAKNGGAINYIYNRGSNVTLQRGDFAHHIVQQWSGVATFTITHSSFLQGDIIEFVNVRGTVTITVVATIIYLPNGSNDTTLTLSKAGKFRLIKYSTNNGYWMVG